LEEVIKSGYQIAVAIGYQIPKSTPSKKIKAIIDLFKLIQFLMKIVLYKKNKQNYHSMKALSDLNKFPLIYTSDPNLTNQINELKKYEFDILLSNGWMFWIPDEITCMAKIEAINCHSSFLPEYRGGNVTFAPLINEEKTSGVTVHVIEKKFDSGKILAQKRISLDSNETPTSLHQKRAHITGEVLVQALSIAGKKELYMENPPSPFYMRCSEKEYFKYVYLNKFRKIIGLKALRYEPVMKEGL